MELQVMGGRRTHQQHQIGAAKLFGRSVDLNIGYYKQFSTFDYHLRRKQITLGMNQLL
jgi:hypothetical protein